MEMGYLIVLYIRLGAKIRDPHARDSNSFRNSEYIIFLYNSAIIL